jgi:hypothetical protein
MTPGLDEGPQGRGRQWAPERGPPHKEGRTNINVASQYAAFDRIAKTQTHRVGVVARQRTG